MQREIRFRAWLFGSQRMTNMGMPTNAVTPGRLVDVGQMEFFEDGNISINDGLLQLAGGKKQFELMQYTGLKDGSDPPKEIYEGDIIKQKYPNIYLDKESEIIFEVIFEEGCFRGESLTSGEVFHWVEWPILYFKGCEIIGNIYENPGLTGVE